MTMPAISLCLRSVMLPMAEPVGMTWDDFWPAMNEAWRVATNLANMMLGALYAADLARQAEFGKVPPLKGLERNLAYTVYRTRRSTLPQDLSSGTASCLAQMAWKRYTGKNMRGRPARWDTLTGNAALPTFRYAAPFPIHNKNWSVTEKDGQLFATFQLVGTAPITVRLKTGGEYARHESGFRRVLGEETKRRELKILHKKGRVPMFSTAVETEVSAVERSGTMSARSAADKFLMVSHGEKIWQYHADHMKIRIDGHGARLQRLADDSKFEPRGIREEISQRREALCDLHHRRMASFMHRVSAWLVNYADRQKVAELVWDDEERGFMDSFPWHQFGTLIAQKCETAGIIYRHVEKTGDANK